MAAISSLDDPSLIRLLQSGSGVAFKEIYERYAADLINFSASKTFSLEIARDIVHDLFVNLWEKRATLNVDGSLKAYLFASVRYRIIDHIRKNITRESYARMIGELKIPAAPDGHQLLEGKELQESINSALNDLSPRVKEVYLLSREEHLSIPEIAQKLNLSEQTVKNQLTTALNHLRRSIPQLLVLWFVVFQS